MRSELDWFIAVAETQNLTAAARQVHVSQPTLSRLIMRLERQAGVPLFDRAGKKLRLNRYGETLLARTRRAVAELDAAQREIDELASPTSGVVRLAFLHSFGIDLVPDLIRGFRRHNSLVGFTLSQDAAETVVGHVVADIADVAIVSPRPSERGMGWAVIESQRLALAVPAGHRFAGRSEIGIAQAMDEPFIVMRHGFGMRRILDELCAADHVEPRITFESTELATIAGLVGAGLGVGLLPDEDAYRRDGVSMVPLAGATREIGLTWVATRKLSRVAEDFRDFVIEFRRGEFQ